MCETNLIAAHTQSAHSQIPHYLSLYLLNTFEYAPTPKSALTVRDNGQQNKQCWKRDKTISLNHTVRVSSQHIYCINDVYAEEKGGAGGYKHNASKIQLIPSVLVSWNT